MPSQEATTNRTSFIAERRRYARRTVYCSVFVNVDPSNGAILFDIGEGGIAIDLIGVSINDALIRVDFRLPGADEIVAANGQIVWKSDSSPRVGVRFMDLPEASREQIRAWLSCEAPSTEFGEDITPKPGLVEAKQATTPGAISMEFRESIAAEPESVETKQAATSASSQEIPRRPVKLVLHVGWRQFRSSLSRLRRIPERTRIKQPAHEQGFRSRYPRRKWVIVVLSGCLAILALLAGASRIGSQTWRMLTKLSSTMKMAGKSAPSDSGQRATSSNADAFQVEVVDVNNQRWLLTARSSPRIGSQNSPRIGPKRIAQRALPDDSARRAEHREARLWPPILKPPRPPNSIARANDQLRDEDNLPEQRGQPGVGYPLPGLVDPHRSPPAPAEPVNAAAPNQHALRQSVPVEPVRIRYVRPIYPAIAKQRGIQGTVQLHAIIGPNGAPRSLEVLSGNPLLSMAAMDAVRSWRYKPASLRGIAVDAEVVINVDFRIGQ